MTNTQTPSVPELPTRAELLEMLRLAKEASADLRRAGRAEAMAIILGTDAEDQLASCVKSVCNYPDGDYSEHWVPEKVAELFDCGSDNPMTSILDRLESAYWDVQGRTMDRIDSLERDLEQARAALEAQKVAQEPGERAKALLYCDQVERQIMEVANGERKPGKVEFQPIGRPIEFVRNGKTHDVSLSYKPAAPAQEPVPDDVQKVWDDFWAPILEIDGRPDIGLIKCELSDYHAMLQEVPKVYMHVTGGRISKPNTLASAVISESDDYITKLVDDEVKEAVQPAAPALVPFSGADEHPPVFGRRWKLAADGFGLQRDDLGGNYVHIDDALSVLHQWQQKDGLTDTQLARIYANCPLDNGLDEFIASVRAYDEARGIGLTAGTASNTNATLTVCGDGGTEA